MDVRQLVLLLLLHCSASVKLVTLSNATQSSDYYADQRFAWWSIDGDVTTQATTKVETNPWLRIYFTHFFDVRSVVIEKGWNTDAACVYQVSVFAGDSKQPCGTFSLKRGSYFNQVITMDHTKFVEGAH